MGIEKNFSRLALSRILDPIRIPVGTPRWKLLVSFDGYSLEATFSSEPLYSGKDTRKDLSRGDTLKRVQPLFFWTFENYGVEWEAEEVKKLKRNGVLFGKKGNRKEKKNIVRHDLSCHFLSCLAWNKPHYSSSGRKGRGSCGISSIFLRKLHPSS